MIDYIALVRGSSQDHCPCYTDQSVHYHHQFILVTALLDVAQWRMGFVTLPYRHYVSWAAIGGMTRSFL